VKLALVLAGTGAALILILVGVALHDSEGESSPSAGPFRGSEPPVEIAMPPFVLRDQDGRVVRAGDLRGTVVVLTFLDTKCREACPIIAGEIARAWTLLTRAERKRAVAIAISTDPRDDTPASIRAFLASRHATRTIRYLTGPVPAMKRLWRRFQILSSFQSGEAATHSAPVRIYGPDLTWLSTQHPGADLSPDNLAHDIRVALTGG
jgi:cytochrome oxidase Cu insertion factor (SCO1/SenC/PrrC family)